MGVVFKITVAGIIGVALGASLALWVSRLKSPSSLAPHEYMLGLHACGDMIRPGEECSVKLSLPSSAPGPQPIPYH